MEKEKEDVQTLNQFIRDARFCNSTLEKKFQLHDGTSKNVRCNHERFTLFGFDAVFGQYFFRRKKKNLIFG